MSYRDMTAAQRKGGHLPTRLECSVCRTFKGQEHFSKKQLSTAQWKRVNGGGSSDLRCVKCTGGGGRLELECDKCGDTKAHTQFSKTSRSAGGNQWCFECTIYKDAALPDSSQNEVAGPELGGQMVGGVYIDNEWAASDTVLGKSTSNVGTPSFANTSRNDDSFTILASRLKAMKLQGAQTSSATPQAALDVYVPPLERKNVSQDDNKSTSSASNVYEGARSTATKSAVDEAQVWQTVNPPKRTYTAWGHNGQQQTRQASEPSSDSRTPVSSTYATPTPPTASVPAPPSSGRSGGWAKPAGNRTITNSFNPPEPVEINNRYDDSDSDDFDDP